MVFICCVVSRVADCVVFGMWCWRLVGLTPLVLVLLVKALLLTLCWRLAGCYDYVLRCWWFNLLLR